MDVNRWRRYLRSIYSSNPGDIISPAYISGYDRTAGRLRLTRDGGNQYLPSGSNGYQIEGEQVRGNRYSDRRHAPRIASAAGSVFVPTRKQADLKLQILFWIYDPDADISRWYVGGDRYRPQFLFDSPGPASGSRHRISISNLGRGDWIVPHPLALRQYSSIPEQNWIASHPATFDHLGSGYWYALDNSSGAWVPPGSPLPRPLFIAEALPAFPRWHWIHGGEIFSSTDPVFSFFHDLALARTWRSIATSGSLPFHVGPYSASCYGDSQGVLDGVTSYHTDTCTSTLPLVCGVSSSWRVAVDYSWRSEVVGVDVVLNGTYWGDSYGGIGLEQYYPPNLTYRNYIDRDPLPPLRGHRFDYIQTPRNANLVRTDLYLVDASQPMIEVLGDMDTYLEVEHYDLVSGQLSQFKTRVLPLRVLGQGYTGIAGLSYHP